MFYDFQTNTHGKWILAGEHAVVRGKPALVFPVTEKQLTLSYLKSPSTLSADYEGEHGSDMHLLFWSVLEQGLQQLGKSLNSLQGKFHIVNDIPIGVGMGASAALCVAMSRWFISEGFLGPERLYFFSKSLEDLFHGQSSGLDIAGASSDSAVYFQKDRSEPMQLAWKPKWYLSSCAQIGITSHCISQVQSLWKEKPEFAASIDEKMAGSVSLAKASLETVRPDSLSNLAKAINTAADCFKQWELISESLQQHIQQLTEQGALAVKPTGSGGGGYVISLWEQKPLASDIDFIAL